MDLRKTKVTLDKINALYKSLSASGDPVSSIERDLMLTYVRQLYELVLETPAPSAFGDSPAPLKKKPDTTTFEVVPPAPRKPPAPPEPSKIDKNEEKPPYKPDSSQVPEPTSRNAEPPKPKPQPTPERKSFTPTRSYSNIDKLLEQKKATELSEILSERPISDLTRAMSINDRLLYMNELFGKDLEALNSSLALLNKYDNIEEAKGLLANLADQYEWLKEEKIDFARTFIKLVRRRYKKS